MTGVEIGLLVAGAIFIVAGNLFTEKKISKESANGRELWSDKDEVTIKDRVNLVLSDKSEQIINETDDKLCHLSNEKIMEFQEYADQMLEKLNENHNQTMFMYKMLTDKQDEMKEWITEIDTMHSSVKDELNGFLVSNSSDSEINSVIQDNKENVKNDFKPELMEVEENSGNNMSKNKSEKNEKKDSIVNTNLNGVSNKNEKILELYDSGKSIVEVSKMLGIGQGEVKLVVGLYRGK